MDFVWLLISTLFFAALGGSLRLIEALGTEA
jgi:hypothetical protein